jgi:hypothetical protein
MKSYTGPQTWMYSLEQPRQRDNIRMDLREVGCEDVDWLHLDQDRDQWWALVNTVMNLCFHKRQ